jgi:(E)-4-hydroxy-3-methylbut-2-enyl-diphosphate synthase
MNKNPLLFRLKNKAVFLGNLAIGSDYPVRIQSMCNTDTMDTEATLRQCLDLAKLGCEIIRIACPSVKDAENLQKIKEKLRENGCFIPLIADVHFNPKVAEIAAAIVEKVRINPGNYIDRKGDKVFDKEKAIARLQPLVDICKKHETAIRVGSNHGSLSDRILNKYGNTAEAMVFSALEFVDILENLGFYKTIISMKSSSVKMMIDANRLLVKEMQKREWQYPLHLGVTEAGSGNEAIIKSACGIGSLLKEGIGDTIRVSLTGNPQKEIPVAQQITALCPGDKKRFSYFLENDILHKKKPDFLVVGNKETTNYPADINVLDTKKLGFQFLEEGEFPESSSETKSILTIKENTYSPSDYTIYAAAASAAYLLSYTCSGLYLQHSKLSAEENNRLSFEILQSLKLKITTNEYIACPSCGRTLCDVEKVLEEVKKRTSNYKGLIIGVMGCIVNGPGEMQGADFGLVGSGKNQFSLFVKGKITQKNIPEKEAVDVLLDVIGKTVG